MSYIGVQDLTKSFSLRKKREKGHLPREKSSVQALRGVSYEHIVQKHYHLMWLTVTIFT